MLVLLTAAALGAPVFVSDDAADAVLAKAAWQAATQCAGWEAEAHERVRIERRALQKDYLGLATNDEAGLVSIQLDPDGKPEVLLHEIAHAWVNKGPTALVEGRAELLADCMVHRDPALGTLQWDDGRELTALPSLKQWDSQEDHGPTVNPLLRTDAYLGAARLVRLASMVLPERALWPADDDVTWESLEAMLTEVGSVGQPIIAVLNADVPFQQGALADRDRDGLVDLGEALFQTDPDDFDSDRDGWWDGAAVVAHVQPLPFDNTPVCTGWALPATGGVVHLRTGGNLRGAPAPVPMIRASGRAVQPKLGGVRVATSGSVLVELDGDAGYASGGLWARVEGSDLVRDAHCRSDRDHVVWAQDPRLRRHVGAVSDELLSALERAEAKLGPTGRLAVQLGGAITTIDGPIVYLSSDEVRAALARDDIEGLANLAVAMRRVWDGSLTRRSWRDVIAVSRALGSDRVDALVLEDAG